MGRHPSETHVDVRRTSAELLVLAVVGVATSLDQLFPACVLRRASAILQVTMVTPLGMFDTLHCNHVLAINRTQLEPICVRSVAVIIPELHDNRKSANASAIVKLWLEPPTRR